MPYTEWLERIRDQHTRARIRRYTDRLETGNFGDHHGVGDGVFEMRLFFGAGYCIYFAEDGDTVVVLLSGGEKSTQDRDIARAKAYWADYHERTI
jgi:putative addiction module killer protein